MGAEYHSAGPHLDRLEARRPGPQHRGIAAQPAGCGKVEVAGYTDCGSVACGWWDRRGSQCVNGALPPDHRVPEWGGRKQQAGTASRRGAARGQGGMQRQVVAGPMQEAGHVQPILAGAGGVGTWHAHSGVPADQLRALVWGQHAVGHTALRSRGRRTQCTPALRGWCCQHCAVVSSAAAVRAAGVRTLGWRPRRAIQQAFVRAARAYHGARALQRRALRLPWYVRPRWCECRGARLSSFQHNGTGHRPAVLPAVASS